MLIISGATVNADGAGDADAAAEAAGVGIGVDVDAGVGVDVGVGVGCVAPAGNTVTNASALRPPSTVVTVMVAVPGLTALTTPSFTVATDKSEVLQVTDLLLADSGRTFAVKASLSPGANVSVSLLSVTPVTGTDAADDITFSSAVFRTRIRSPPE
ncbi:hypothetical protein D3C81_1226210 [compost metagenome]